MIKSLNENALDFSQDWIVTVYDDNDMEVDSWEIKDKYFSPHSLETCSNVCVYVDSVLNVNPSIPWSLILFKYV